MGIRSTMCWLGVTAVLSSVLAADEPKKPDAESMGWKHMATLSPLKAAPVLDGKLAGGEWDGAVGTVNFLDLGQTDGREEPSAKAMFMELRGGRTYCGWHGDRLYIAVVSELPPRSMSGKYSWPANRDAELVFDPNGIEIWLDPNRDRRETREGDQAFYQIFVNTLGSLYDARLEPGKAPDKGWDADIQTANTTDSTSKTWTMEMSVPLKDLGFTPPHAGKSMGVLIARNYKSLWQQVTWFPHGRPFVSWQFYPRLIFTPDEPVVAVASLGDKFWEARPDFVLKITNPGPARTAKVKTHIRSSDMPDLRDEKEIALPANGAAEYRFKPGDGTLHETADHLAKFRVEAADGNTAWFDYALMWSRDPMTAKGWSVVRRSTMNLKFEDKWAIRVVAQPENAVGISVYPTFGKIRVGVDASMLVADPEGADKDKLSSSAVVTLARNGQELGRTQLSWDVSKLQYGKGHEFNLPDLPAGEYVVTAKFDKYNEPLTRKYTRIVFPWEGTKVGVTDTIYPPFEAVKATDAATQVVGREYQVGDLGLWKSVKSLDKEILAGPMVVKVRSQESGDRSQKEEGGRPLPPNSDATARVPPGEDILTGRAKLVKSSPMSAVYEAEAKHPAVTVKSRCTTEIDGCMKVELTLLPPEDRSQKSGARSQNGTLNTEHRTLNTLVLEVPLKDELAPLWHAVTTALRVNPAGEAPAGQGVVWDSRKFPNGDWIGNFTPYLWLGGIDRGLCFFANNDRGWVLNWNEKKQFSPCEELIRKDGALTLRLNLVQKPVTLAEPRRIVFGLMASPGKPIPYKDWRGIQGKDLHLGKGFEYLPSFQFDMGRVVEEIFCAAYPYNRDYSVYDALHLIKGTPGGDLAREKGMGAFIEDWKKRNGLDKPQEQLDEGQKRAMGKFGNAVEMKADTKDFCTYYWDEYHSDSARHPETQVFNGEWGGNNMAASRRDFRCYYGAEAVKRGFGLYFDNAYPHASRDPMTSDAYEIPGFGWQPSAGIWEQRDYHRRIWNIHREFGARWNNAPMATIHMTNTRVIPYLTWADASWDLEWFFGPEPQQSKYSLGLLQVESMGRQDGCVPMVLARVTNCRTPAEQRLASRSRFGCMMVHDIKYEESGGEIDTKLNRILYGFGYGQTDMEKSPVKGATVHNYWDENYPVKPDNPLIKSLLVKRGAELLLLVCSWDKDPRTANFVFDTAALGVKPASAEDAEGDWAEQEKACKDQIEMRRKALGASRTAYEDAQRKFDEKKLAAADLDYRKKVYEASELHLKNAEAMLSISEAAAKLPVAYDAAKGALTVGLEGYGVRMIKLK